MSAPEVNTQSTPRVAHSAFSKSKKEDGAMRIASRTSKVNIPVKVLVGLAAGAMLITATAFAYLELGQGTAGSTSYGEGSEVWSGSGMPDTPYYNNPDYRESELGQDKAGSPTFTSETTEAFQDPAYWVQRAEAYEILLDELREAFIGIPASGSETTRAFQNPSYLGSQDHEAVERLLDEVREAFFGITSFSN